MIERCPPGLETIPTLSEIVNARQDAFVKGSVSDLIFFLLHVVELPVAITSLTIASNWGCIKTEGPLHCVLDVQGFPAQPFGSGTFQNAFKATCIVPNKFLDLSGRYVLKQQKLEGPLTTEAVEGLSSEDMDLMDEESSRKSAKVL